MIFWSQRRNSVFLSLHFPCSSSHIVILYWLLIFNIINDLISPLKVVSNPIASFSIMWNSYFNVRYLCNFKDSFYYFWLYRYVFIWTWVQVSAVFWGVRSPVTGVGVLKQLLELTPSSGRAMIVFICQTMSLDHNVVLGRFQLLQS